MAVAETSRGAERNGLFSGYRPLPGSFDEMCAAPGEARKHWHYLVGALEQLGRKGLDKRWREAKRLIRDNGVTYNVYGDPQGMSRPWELDLLPLLVASSDWSHIERGLTQRAEVLNQVLLDLYCGPRKLIRDGLLPPGFVYSHPGYLLPCQGVPVSAARPVVFYAADLARDPDGGYVVIGDRTQAPSGAGYALENRLVLSRVLPSLFRDSHVHRLAGFFRTVRHRMAALAPRPQEDVRVVLLSPGSSNEAHFEHAYLANYLGYTLVQGADLTVRDATLWLKTLDGLERVDVVLRRVDDAFCDPLELRSDSFLGVPGLLQAVRSGNVTLANALGSGILEHPGLQRFLPGLCKALLGEDPILPGIQTWWCGERTERDYVIRNLARLVIKPAAVPGWERCIFGAQLDAEGLTRLRAAIQANPYAFAAQEPTRLSTAPVLTSEGIEPRPAVIRTFLVTDGTDYSVMPGGLARVAPAGDSLRVSNQLGGIGKDIWLLASEPEREDSLLGQTDRPATTRRLGNEVSSRVADNLYWIGRYAERAESLVRLLRIIILELTERPSLGAAGTDTNYRRHLLQALTSQTLTFPGFIGEGATERLADPDPELLSLLADHTRVGGLPQTLQALVQAAWSVRDRLSMDTWRVVNDIEVRRRSLTRRPPVLLGGALDGLDPLITALVAFTALSNENMLHNEGWHFLEAGRRLERALNTANLLHATLVPVFAPSEETPLTEAVLSITDSLIAFRRRYPSGIRVGAMLDLVFQDESNPRSLAFQLARLLEVTSALPKMEPAANLSPLQRLVLEAITEVRLADIAQLSAIPDAAVRRAPLAALLEKLGRLVPQISDTLTAVYFRHEERPYWLLGQEEAAAP